MGSLITTWENIPNGMLYTSGYLSFLPKRINNKIIFATKFNQGTIAW